jgi:hypothetical protein
MLQGDLQGYIRRRIIEVHVGLGKTDQEATVLADEHTERLHSDTVQEVHRVMAEDPDHPCGELQAWQGSVFETLNDWIASLDQ